MELRSRIRFLPVVAMSICISMAFIPSASSEQADFGDDMNSEMARGLAGAVEGGDREQRGTNIHNQMTEDRLQRIENNQGDAARLREEQQYRRTHPGSTE